MYRIKQLEVYMIGRFINYAAIVKFFLLERGSNTPLMRLLYQLPNLREIGSSGGHVLRSSLPLASEYLV